MKEPVKCIVCGELFAPVNSSHQICGRSCQRERKRTMAKENLGLYDAMRIREAQKVKKPPEKIDWKAVVRVCNENQVSYGEAVRRGLI